MNLRSTVTRLHARHHHHAARSTHGSLVRQDAVSHVVAQTAQHQNCGDPSRNFLSILKRLLAESETRYALAGDAGVAGLVHVAVPAHAGWVNELQL